MRTKKLPLKDIIVTLHARVWIEIHLPRETEYIVFVTLHARVWIEIKLETVRKQCE